MLVKTSSEQAKRRRSCDPGPNRTLLTIGQDYFSIQEYIMEQYNASLHRSSTMPLKSFHPAATMFYTDIQSLRGMDTPTDYGSGIEYAPGLAESFPASGIQVGLWLNGTAGCRDIVNGELEENVKHFFESLARWKVPKVFLRVGYEFDNPYFGYSEGPSIYVNAFRWMVSACQQTLGYEKCHQDVAFVWHSWAAPRWIESLNDFYPGDDVVDYVGISIFQQVYPWANSTSNFAGGTLDNLMEVLDFAKGAEKPVMIAESTPFGGVFWNGKDFGNGIPPIGLSDSHSTARDIWNLWFEPVLDLIETYDIRVWSYINSDWNSQPMWHNIGFGDTRLSSSTDVMEKWRLRVLENPRFVVAPLKCDNWTGPQKVSDAMSTSVTLLPTFMFLAEWSADETITAALKLLFLTTGVIVVLLHLYRQVVPSHSGNSTRERPLSSEANDGQQNYGSLSESL